MDTTVLTAPAQAMPPFAPRGATVALRDVSKAFGTHGVLHGIDLDILPGEFVAVIGRSGCGKSTLLRLLAGLDEPTTGDIVVGEQRDDQSSIVRLMFQEPRLLPWQHVADNVAVGLAHAQTRRERRALAAGALRQVGLAGREQHWPMVLSGGQKQRVALARALVSHPGLLLLDEPLGALDALSRIEMQDLIESVWLEKGFTAIVVTHDVSEAVALADRILLLEQGRIALDIDVNLPRPRHRGNAATAEIEGRVLDRLLGRQHG
jgi:sulfonate transport system ATP-binding protein